MTDVITSADKLRCAERELALRKRVYRNRLETGRMRARQVAHELACMESILEDYRALVEKERLL